MHGGFLMSLEKDVIDMIAVNRWWRDFQQIDFGSQSGIDGVS